MSARPKGAKKLAPLAAAPTPAAKPPVIQLAGEVVHVQLKDGRHSFPPQGRVFQWSDIKVGHVIGVGSQAKVRKVKHTPTGNTYALKVIQMDQKSYKGVQVELGHVLHPNHPNVVQSTEAFFVDGAIRILMEYMDLGTLQDLIRLAGPVPEVQLSCISRQIVEGLSSLHESEVVHRDIKPSNLLLNSHGLVKISDFGVSTILNSVNPQAETLIGSTAYMSPERVKAEKYDWHSDIWGVGMTIAQCALGVYPLLPDTTPDENPFTARPNLFDLAAKIAEWQDNVDFDGILAKIKRWQPTRCPAEISQDLRDFVYLSMCPQAEKRPSCSDLLQHPFITRHAQYTPHDLRRWLRETGVTKENLAKSNGDGSVPTDAGIGPGTPRSFDVPEDNAAGPHSEPTTPDVTR